MWLIISLLLKKVLGFEKMTETAYVKTWSKDGLTTITFYHPSHNALPSDILSSLAESLIKTGNDPACKLILLQSAGDSTFCAGANFDELLTIADEASGKVFFSGFAKVINAIRQVPQFVIGRVQGKAVGGGVGLAAACDYCFAVENAAVKLSELSIHLGPFVISPPLKRKIGLSAFTELSLNPTRFFEAQWAEKKGLFNQLFENYQLMDGAIGDFCQLLLEKNAGALFALKKDLWMGTEHWDTLLYEQAAISGRLVLTDECKTCLNKK
ncbi:methylglutaconyl-CoA hydratase [bacterium A37T11]|nr:methylglutaconyl-CoA hydratase [bacterium A37T11]